MKNISNYCLTLNPDHEKKILKLNYLPVGLGDKKFSDMFFTDKTGSNISEKNPYYGEYTFHYWLWKNYLDKIETEWVGFCQYRKFFFIQKVQENENNLTFETIKKFSLQTIPKSYQNFDCILGEPFPVHNFKFVKFAKKNFVKLVKSPSVMFNKKKRTIKFHFDIFHGEKNLDKAIGLLDIDHKEDFSNFVNSKTEFNPHNMFACKKNILKKYYDSVFPWLERCENIFGFENLQGYGMKRIYGFLAERYLSYWFSKNCRVKELPIIVKDLSDYKNL